MKATDVASGPDGFEHWKFECSKCGDTKANLIASDPLKSNAVGWLSGELGHSEIRRDKDGHLAAERFTGTKNPPA
jgi:hypothetical protein